MDNQPKPKSVSFIELLTLLFIACKLTHQIDWSWWWVISPILISCIVMFCAGMIQGYRNAKR